MCVYVLKKGKNLVSNRVKLVLIFVLLNTIQIELKKFKIIKKKTFTNLISILKLKKKPTTQKIFHRN